MGWWDTTDTTDFATDAIDAGAAGDVPQASNGGYNWGSGDINLGSIGALVPNVYPTGAMGGAAAAVGAGVAAGARMVAPALFNAIVKLSQRLGGATGSVMGYGRRVWGQLSSWAAKNPGVSLIATLTSLGLTVEEAAHFIAWGATNKRKRRGRGINARDIRTTRRTMRKLRSLNHLIATSCAPLVRHRRHK